MGVWWGFLVLFHATIQPYLNYGKKLNTLTEVDIRLFDYK